MTLLKTLIHAILALGTLTILVPRWLLFSPIGVHRLDLGILRLLGLAPILLGALIYMWCAWDFTITGKGTPAPIDPPKELVVRGLYRYVRNPMYVGLGAVLIGEAVLFQSLALAAYAGIALLSFSLFVVFYEEPALTRKFGESYRRYREAVPRWIPAIKR